MKMIVLFFLFFFLPVNRKLGGGNDGVKKNYTQNIYRSKTI